MTGDFFIVDRRTWGEVCQLGMNPSCAYLVLARGSQADNRHTSWSINAVKQYTGISVERAQQAVQALRESLFIQQIKSGWNPQYELLRWIERRNALAGRTLAGQVLSPSERRVYESIADGKQPSGGDQQEIADKLLGHGLLHRDGSIYLKEWIEPLEETSQNLIWLPNELVSGTGESEASPVAHVRRSEDVMALRLLVDLYRDQNLRDDGGISRRVLRREFKRDQVDKVRRYNIFAFTPGEYLARNTGAAACHFAGTGGSDFDHRLSILRECGLIDFIPHLCESPSPDSEIIHPCGLDWTPQGLLDPENEVSWLANEAAKAMADPTKYMQAVTASAMLFIPVSKDYPHAHVVGIARMRHRPRTMRTIRWTEEGESVLRTWITHYSQLRYDTEQRRARGAAGV